MNIALALNQIADYPTLWVLWLLFGLSVLALGLIIERSIVFYRTRVDVERMRHQLVEQLHARDRDSAQHMLVTSTGFEARIAAAALGAGGPEVARERIAAESQLVKLDMERGLNFLATLGSNAPFIGLLGTVIGIVRAFRELNQTLGQISSTLLSEIGEALIATAIGLLVALPAVAFFNAFNGLIRGRLQRGDSLSRHVMEFLFEQQQTRTAGSVESV